MTNKDISVPRERCENGQHVWAHVGTFAAGEALCECGLITARGNGRISDGMGDYDIDGIPSVDELPPGFHVYRSRKVVHFDGD